MNGGAHCAVPKPSQIPLISPGLDALQGSWEHNSDRIALRIESSTIIFQTYLSDDEKLLSSCLIAYLKDI